MPPKSGAQLSTNRDDMGTKYSTVTISGYNSSAPSDDGSTTEANKVKWSTIKTKLNDPVKTRTDSMDTALIAAFAKMVGGAGIDL